MDDSLLAVAVTKSQAGYLCFCQFHSVCWYHRDFLLHVSMYSKAHYTGHPESTLYAAHIMSQLHGDVYKATFAIWVPL